MIAEIVSGAYAMVTGIPILLRLPLFAVAVWAATVW
jgi:hypothetical protein